MRKPEQRLWDTMRSNLPKGAGIVLERNENAAADGQPDVLVLAHNRIANVELKVAKRPVRATTRMLGDKGLRASQETWHMRAAQLLLPVYTLIRDDRQELYLIHCSHSCLLNEMTVEQLRAVRAAGTWPEIFNELAGLK